MKRSLLTALAFAVSLGLAHTAFAQDDDARAQAREQFNLGVSRYEQGDYQGALEAFQEAYRLAPHPMVRVNMANCYEHLGRPLEALHHFERFLAEAESATREQRREVEASIRRLEQQVGEVRLAITPDGATVTIDSAETRRTPILEPVRLTAGTHQIDVRLEGYRSEHREIQVTGGGSERIAIRLERGASEPVAATEPTEPEPVATEPAAQPTEAAIATEPAAVEEPEPAANQVGGGFEFRLTTPVIVAGSAAIAFTVAAVITGSVALASNGSFEDAVVRSNDGSLSQEERAQAHADGLAAADTANTTKVLTDIFIIGAIASAGLTAFFVIIDGMGQEESATAGLRIAPSVGQNGGGLLVAGRF